MTTTTQQTQDAAAMIVQELRSICTDERLARFALDETGADSLEQHKSLVRTRLGGDYSSAAWDAAMEQMYALAPDLAAAAGM